MKLAEPTQLLSSAGRLKTTWCQKISEEDASITDITGMNNLLPRPKCKYVQHFVYSPDYKTATQKVSELVLQPHEICC